MYLPGEGDVSKGSMGSIFSAAVFLSRRSADEFSTSVTGPAFHKIVRPEVFREGRCRARSLSARSFKVRHRRGEVGIRGKWLPMVDLVSFVVRRQFVRILQQSREVRQG